MEPFHTVGGKWAGRIAFSLLPLLFLASTCLAEPRVFTDTKGREIIAEIVAWKGNTITLEKDGKTFTTPIALYSAADQAFIAAWMKKNPPKIDYNFDFDVEKKKIEEETTGVGYERRKRGKYVYHVTVKNRSRDEVSGLQVKYRAYVVTRVPDSYYEESRSETVQRDGTIKLPALKMNLAAEFDTEAFEMREGNSYYTNGLIKDEFIGILIRIFDAQGNIVADFSDGGTGIKDKKWEAEGSGDAAIVKPLGS